MGLRDFVARSLASLGSPRQVIGKRLRLLPGGHDIPPLRIAREMTKLAKLVLEHGSDRLVGLVDHEQRSEDWQSFITACRSELQSMDSPQRCRIGIASRAIEAWFMANVAACCRAVRPTKSEPSQERYPRVESIPHPVASELKKFWPGYGKTKEGTKFLAAIEPGEVRKRSESYADFVDALRSLDEP